MVVIRNNSGSVEHFYHFILGFLLPLCRYLVRFPPGQLPQITIRSCGPLDHIIAELCIPGLRICPKQAFAEMLARPQSPGISIVRLRGYDLKGDGRTYRRRKLRRGAAAVQRLIAHALRRETKQLRRWSRPRVLLIERGEPDPFYSSELAEKGGSGASRRSIRNQAELRDALVAAYRDCVPVRLEGVPLARQVALFRLADIVVAQHGAALANIVWMRPGAHVVEISHRRGMFGLLSRSVGVGYDRVRQKGEQGPVSTAAVMQRVAAAASRRPHFPLFSGIQPRAWGGGVRRMIRAMRAKRSG